VSDIKPSNRPPNQSHSCQKIDHWLLTTIHCEHLFLAKVAVSCI